ncbi:MAG: hypothetical protein MJZ20_02975 [Bacteroidaceae bacterium]|nr:hypothetical protein [Bacteroidaceae bacterium]
MAEKPKANMLTQFNAGEFSNALAGRVDYARLKSSLRKAVNVIPEVAGGLKKFYGTKFIAEVENTKNFCMIPFHHEDANYTIVFYDGKVGVIENETFKELDIAAPVVADYQTIRYEQANDVVFCVAEDTAPFRIAYYGEGNFAIEDVSFDDVPYFPFGYTGNYSSALQVTGVTGTVVATVPGSLTEDNLKFTYPAELSVSGSDNLTGNVYDGYRTKRNVDRFGKARLGNITVSIYKENADGSHDVVFSSIVNNISSNYRVDVGPTEYSGRNTRSDGTVDYLGYKRNTLSFGSCVSAIKGSFAGTFSADGEIYVPVSNIPGYASGDRYYLTVSVEDSYSVLDNDGWFGYNASAPAVSRWYGLVTQTSAKSFTKGPAAFIHGDMVFSDQQNLIGRKIKFYQNAQSDAVKVWYQGLSVSAGNVGSLVVLSDGHYYLARSSGTCGNIKPTHTEGTVSDAGVNWQYLHSGTTTATIVGVDSSTSIKLVVDDGQYLPVPSLATTTNTFTNYRWSMWGADGLYPSQVFFCGGRLGFITNTSFGTYYSLSKTDSYTDFAEETYGKTLDTDSITGLVSGGHVSNKINWVIAREKVYMGSYGAEFVLGGNNDNITPTTVYCKPVSFTGGDKVQALKYMTMSLFVGANAKELYTVNYDYATESYIPTNVSYVSEHLLADKIKKLAGAPRPDKTIYILSKDGKLTQFVNYITEQVAAFSELDLGGKILDIAVSYSGNNTEITIAREGQTGVDLESFSVEEPNYMLSQQTFETKSAKLYGWTDSDGNTIYTRQTGPDTAMEGIYYSDGTERTTYKSNIISRYNESDDSVEVVTTSSARHLYGWKQEISVFYSAPEVVYTDTEAFIEPTSVYYEDGSFANVILATNIADNTLYVTLVDGSEIRYGRVQAEDKDDVDVDVVTRFVRNSTWDTTAVYKKISCPRFANKEVWVKYVPFLQKEAQFQKVMLDANGEYSIKDGLTEYTVGLPMPMEINTQPLSGAKLEGFQQSSIRVLFRLLNTGHFSYGCSNDEEKYIDFDPWSVKQEYERAHELATGDVQLDIPYGYMKKSNVADSVYPNNTGVGINIKSDSPEPFNLLLISEVYK